MHFANIHLTNKIGQKTFGLLKFDYQTFGQHKFGPNNMAIKHFIDRHLANRHLANRQLAKRRLVKIHLLNRTELDLILHAGNLSERNINIRLLKFSGTNALAYCTKDSENFCASKKI
jgi:hypothetical protein